MPRWVTIGHVPDSSDASTEIRNIAAKNTPDPAPSRMPCRVPVAPGAHDVRNSADHPHRDPEPAEHAGHLAAGAVDQHRQHRRHHRRERCRDADARHRVRTPQRGECDRHHHARQGTEQQVARSTACRAPASRSAPPVHRPGTPPSWSAAPWSAPPSAPPGSPTPRSATKRAARARSPRPSTLTTERLVPRVVSDTSRQGRATYTRRDRRRDGSDTTRPALPAQPQRTGCARYRTLGSVHLPGLAGAGPVATSIASTTVVARCAIARWAGLTRPASTAVSKNRNRCSK